VSGKQKHALSDIRQKTAFKGSGMMDLKFFRHPLWSVGFRPLFILAFVSGALLPVLWYTVYTSRVYLNIPIASVQWHAHEMYFGFGWAVLGGFLLTASRNWTGTRGYHGMALALLVVLWLVDRAAFWLPADMPYLVPLVAHNAFMFVIVPMILWTLLGNLQKIEKDNWYFIIGLPLFIVSKNLLFTVNYFELGWTLSNGLFRLMVAIMLERTLAAFMQAHYQQQLPRNRWLDAAIRFAIFVAVFEAAMPRWLAIAVLGIAAALLLYRFALWKPKLGFSTLDTGVSFAAYLALVLGLILECFRLAGKRHTVGDVATHVFTLLSMGLVMAAMMIRISQGHTARAIVFAQSDRAAIWLLGVGGLVRIVLPQLWPQFYPAFLLIASLSWEAGFFMLGWRLMPFLMKPRLDGKES
jgi:uncharacterized protein involved in response to NO